MSVVIKAEHISKQYKLGAVGLSNLTDDVQRLMAKLKGKEDPFLKVGEVNDRTKKGSSEYVWALKDINFEINQGEVVGIIGKNGAGKSTLLKILSRVTEPTLGRLSFKGRMSSLLEVGTGFHPELSGRDNIYLNGAILGMNKREITSKLDEIIAFSGVERYIETPVKRYSSGMYVRLAFAVAAHLEPDILIIDEVLAVGDQEFQDKCIGKMKDVAGQGRTVLFVSHNMVAVKSLCSKGIMLENGVVICDDNMENVLAIYGSETKNATSDLKEIKNRSGVNEIIATKIYLSSENNSELKSGSKAIFNLHYECNQYDENANYEFVVGVWNSIGTPMFMLTNAYLNKKMNIYKEGGKISFVMESLALNKGNYSVNILIKKNEIDQDFIENAYYFKVEDGDYFNTKLFYPENYEGFYQNFDMLSE